MSEFSESYHLKSNNQQDGIALLNRAGLKGFVFPATGGWVTIVPEGLEFQLNEELIEANTGILLYYVNAEDHGWHFSIYKGTEVLCSYDCFWEEDLEVNDEGLDLETLFELINDKSAQDELKEILNPESFEDLDESPASLLAEKLGLTYFSWVSYNYVADDIENIEAKVDNLIVV